jgi:hypothetical protein
LHLHNRGKDLAGAAEAVYMHACIHT